MYKFCLGINLAGLLMQIGMMLGFKPQCSLSTIIVEALGVLFCCVQVWEEK